MSHANTMANATGSMCMCMDAVLHTQEGWQEDVRISIKPMRISFLRNTQFCYKTPSPPTWKPESRGTKGGRSCPQDPNMYILKWISKWIFPGPQYAKQETQWAWSLEVEPTLIGRRPRVEQGVINDQGKSHSSIVNLLSPPALPFPLWEQGKPHPHSSGVLHRWRLCTSTCFCFLPEEALKGNTQSA